MKEMQEAEEIARQEKLLKEQRLKKEREERKRKQVIRIRFELFSLARDLEAN